MRATAILILIFCTKFSCAQTEKHIVFIGVDGLSISGVKNANTPVLDSLMQQGSYSLKARAVYPTFSAPNWASMIMAVSPKKHKIKSNAWKIEDIEKKKTGSWEGILPPTIFELVRNNYPNANIACFHDWKEFENLVDRNSFNTLLHTPGEDSTTNTSCRYIFDNKPLLNFIHLDHVDHAGHHYGHGSKEYYLAVGKADSLIGKIIQSAKSAGIIENTIFLITSDHGGRRKGHGGFTKKEKRIPWFIAGPGVRKGKEIKTKVKTFDTAATIAYLLNCKYPDYWQGKPVQSCMSMCLRKSRK